MTWSCEHDTMKHESYTVIKVTSQDKKGLTLLIYENNKLR